MAKKTSYDRMYREYDVKNYENNVDTKIEEPMEIVPEIKEEIKEDIKVEKKIPSFIGTVIGGGNLNVRRSPGGDVITSIKEGTQITIIDESNTDWYKIESPVKGYVMKKFVKA